MKLIDMVVKDFCDEVDSSSPAPGGGSVSALSSNIGVSLSRMMCNLSFNKKKYEALDEDIKIEFKSRFEKLGKIRDELLSLVDKDTDAFNEVMDAFALAKETDEDKKIRSEAIQKATLSSINVPLRTAEISFEAMKLIEYFEAYGNQNAITDLGVGVLLLYSGIEGAILNVKVNVLGLKDKEKALEIYNKSEKLISDSKNLREDILSKIHTKLKLS